MPVTHFIYNRVATGTMVLQRLSKHRILYSALLSLLAAGISASNGLVQAASLATANTPTFEGKSDDWKGFRRVHFSFRQRAAYVVKPNHPAPGNPWIWRARFPNFHASADVALLKRGFHVAYLNTDGLLGSAVAMEAWDQFYQFCIEHRLAKRVALEGVSRGGLFVYGFAARWPERVSCIYADTPVCDIRSWPGGKGNGKGSPREWKSCLTHYGLTEDTSAQFRGSPIDQLEPIANARIPLLHIISMNDTIVPPAENTLVMKTRYGKLGGMLEVIQVEEGTAASNGHHFEHPDPIRVADWIERHATIFPSSNPSSSYSIRRGTFGSSRHTFERTGKGRVAFLGGSITHNRGWRNETMTYLQSRFPSTTFEFINAGIPSTGSVPGAFRFENDVLTHGKIDLLFQEASVNDLTNDRSAAQQTRGMEGVVRHALTANPNMDVVVMHFACPQHSADYRKGTVPRTVQLHEAVAKHYRVASVHLAREVTDRVDVGQFDWKNDFRNLHPSAYGSRIYAATIRRLLSDAWDAQPMLDSTTSTSKRTLPDRIDRHCYDKGKFVALDRTTNRSGFEIKDTDPRAGGVGGAVRAGFVDVPMLVGSTNDAFHLKFRGRAIAIFVVSGPDAGKIEFSVDNQPYQTRELATRFSRNLHLPWVYVLADELDGEKPHQLRLRVIGSDSNPNGNVCRIVRLLVNE